MSTFRVGIIGERDSILGFEALGLGVFPADTPEEAERLLAEAASEGYACIFLSEALARGMESTLEAYRRRPLPAVLLIPSNAGSFGIGMSMLKEAVEKAVGQDILFQERG